MSLDTPLAAELRRVLREEVGQWLRAEQPRQTSAAQAPRTESVDLSASDVAGTTSGRYYPIQGETLTCSAASHGASVLQVSFGRAPPTADHQWIPLHPGKTIRAPTGRRFDDGFRVRRHSDNSYTASAGDLAYLIVDGGREVIEEPPRTPHVSDGGAVSQLLRALTLAGAEVDLRAADAGALSVAGWDGAAIVRLLASAAGRLAINAISGQDGIAAGAGAVGATVPRATLASDDPAVTALQVIDDWDESDRAKVNTIAGQVGVQGDAGANTALTQRVCNATVTGSNGSSGTIDESPSVEILPAAAKRKSAILYNAGPNTVYIAPDGTDATTADFPLPAGGTLTLESTSAIEGICAAGETAVVHWIEERYA